MIDHQEQTMSSLLPKIEKPRISPDKASLSQAARREEVEVFINNTQSAAGVPIFELIRKMDEENVLSRDDRTALHTALYDPNRREYIVKAVQDVELSMNSKFALKRLKILLHQNDAGKPSNVSKPSEDADFSLFSPLSLQLNKESQAHNGRDLSLPLPHVSGPSHSTSSNHDSLIAETVNTRSNITKVVGEDPVYSDFNRKASCCAKISANLLQYKRRNSTPADKWQNRRYAVIVGSGSFNPLTRMHLRTFYIAKQCIEKSTDMVILGSLLSPGHSSLVRERYRTSPLEMIPSPHRLAIAQLAVEESKWMSIDPWEITRRRAMDYLSLLEHVSVMLSRDEDLHHVDIRVLYLCKANTVPKLSPVALRKSNFGVVCVCRPPESDILMDSLGSRWKGLLYVAEDMAIVDASMDTVSSRRVRNKLKANESVETLVGDSVAAYFKAHRIGLKMAGVEPWEESEKKMPKITAGPRSTSTLSAESDSVASFSPTVGQRSNSLPTLSPPVAKELARMKKRRERDEIGVASHRHG